MWTGDFRINLKKSAWIEDAEAQLTSSPADIYGHALTGNLVAVVSIVYHEQRSVVHTQDRTLTPAASRLQYLAVSPPYGRLPVPSDPPVRAAGVLGVYASLGACSARAEPIVLLPVGACARADSLMVDPAGLLGSLSYLYMCRRAYPEVVLQLSSIFDVLALISWVKFHLSIPVSNQKTEHSGNDRILREYWRIVETTENKRYTVRDSRFGTWIPGAWFGAYQEMSSCCAVGSLEGTENRELKNRATRWSCDNESGGLQSVSCAQERRSSQHEHRMRGDFGAGLADPALRSQKPPEPTRSPSGR
ncbi:hypothetical protein FB451DRAFT_1175848 [Mycena latifolia]|nr:hypothetical protein FB451DRAFT_1175848 [Mycena latifolia]